MKLKTQKRIASVLLKTSPKKVKFDVSKLNEIKEAITREDIRNLIKEKVITKKIVKEQSRSGARKNKLQKRKGRRKNIGSRKGKYGARVRKKRTWINTIRAQRLLLRHLKKKGIINNDTYKDLIRKSKGGFFRSRRHITLYIKEHGLEHGKK